MKLSDQQGEFTHDLAKLILWANKQPGYKITQGCARCAKPGHHKDGSWHYKGLAQDLNLFINGVYQRKTEAHAKMGKKWKSLRPGNTWGGDFSRPDGNHYSKGEGHR